MTLLIIDTQKAIVNDRLYNYEAFVLGVRQLIGAARTGGTEVVYIRHDDGPGTALAKGSDGFEIFAGFAPTENERIFDKRVNSPFRGSGLLEYLRSKKERTLMIAGLQTDYCIDAAVKCGFEHGFEIIVPENANSTFDNGFMSAADSCHYYNDFMWPRRYARCVSLDEALGMLGH